MLTPDIRLLRYVRIHVTFGFTEVILCTRSSRPSDVLRTSEKTLARRRLNKSTRTSYGHFFFLNKRTFRLVKKKRGRERGREKEGGKEIEENLQRFVSLNGLYCIYLRFVIL